MMTHPKLPPKSEYFKHGPSFEHYDTYGDCLFCVLLSPDSMASEYELSQWRTIVAAVAEIEWRQRAARWEEISDLTYNRFWEGAVIDDEAGQARFDQRTKLISRAANQCYDIARQWRAVGDAKATEKWF